MYAYNFPGKQRTGVTISLSSESMCNVYAVSTQFYVSHLSLIMYPPSPPPPPLPPLSLSSYSLLPLSPHTLSPPLPPLSHHILSLLSDEDTDIKAIVKSWLKHHASSPSLAGWIEDYYHPALDWIIKNGDTVTDTTLVGLVVTGLSHLRGAGSKAEFTCGLVRGLGSNLTLESRTKFAKEVSLWQATKLLRALYRTVHVLLLDVDVDVEL